MKRIFSLIVISVGLISITAFTFHIDTTPEDFAFTNLLTVNFDTDKEGTDYRSNTFNDGNFDYWIRSTDVSSGTSTGPKADLDLYSNIQGAGWFVGKDLDQDNPEGKGYLMLKTLDVSAYQGGTIKVKANLGGNTFDKHRYDAADFLKLQYAFDSDIATGANVVNAVPARGDIATGTYTTFGAFYGSGSSVFVNTKSALINDADLDGDGDFAGNGNSNLTATDVITSDSLTNVMTEWTFTFDVGATDTKVSILFLGATTGSAEEIAIDEIVVSAEEGSLAPVSATVSASTLLEGAYNGATLNTTLNTSIPTTQPYSTNGHSGGETAGSIPAGAVDWVLVELREAASAATALASTKVGSAAGFLMSDGSIKATDGTSNLTISLSGNTGSDFFVVVYHRNHLPIMSASAQSASSTLTIDFTSASATVYQGTSAVSALSGGKFGMIAGDADGDGDVDGTDLTTWRGQNGGTFGYNTTNGDFNLDGVINALDRNDYQQKNTSKTSQVPTT